MVVPEYQDGKCEDMLMLLQKSTVENTRQAGGQAAAVSGAPVIPKIIVDMREFRSDLPCLIHKRGIEVIPVTITVSFLLSFQCENKMQLIKNKLF